jgi:hypothetical protein
VVPFRSSSWKSSVPNFASGPFPSPLTTMSVRRQQRKVICVLLLQVASRGLPSSTVVLRKSLRSCELRVLLVAQLEGRAAPQNSFVSIRLVDSKPIGSTIR